MQLTLCNSIDYKQLIKVPITEYWSSNTYMEC